MAPRKNVDKPPTLEKKAKEKKAPKQKIKKEKPKLKIPTVIRIKIPNTTFNNGKSMNLNNVQTKNNKTAKLTKKQLAALTKLEMANEVAQLQLVKKEPVDINEVNPYIEAEKKNAPPRKRGRPKNVQTEATDTTTATGLTDSEDAFDMTPKKRKYVRKVPQPKVPAKKKPVIIRKGKATENKTNESKKTMKPPKATVLKTVTAKPPKTNSESSNKAKAPPKTKPRQKKTVQKKKPDAGNISSSDTMKSPSLLEQLINKTTQMDSLNSYETTCESPKKDSVNPSPVDSRKTSMTGVSELSWTKDISSSSTTTCVTVCSTDFVRIDNKLPILKLTNINHLTPITDTLNQQQIIKDLDLSSDSSSSSSSGLTPKTPERKSSLDTDSHPCTHSEVNNENRLSAMTALERLSANIKKFDEEIMNWIGYDDSDTNVDAKQFQDKVFKVLKVESEVMSLCQKLQRVCSDTKDDVRSLYDSPTAEGNLMDVNDFAVPIVTSESKIVSETNKINNNENMQLCTNENNIVSETNKINNNENMQLCTNENNIVSRVNKINNSENMPLSTEDSESHFTSDKFKYTSFDQNYEDDDALSLFAESLTGMESCKMNSSNASVENAGGNRFEEYIPQPLSEVHREPVSKTVYIPTKISNNFQQAQDSRKIVCEKQRADSTSITKDTEQERNILTATVENIPVATTSNGDSNDSSQLNKSATVEKKNSPCLMSSLYKPINAVKSVIFRGVCFFHLISSCKKLRCYFPHVTFNPAEISLRLVRLSEEAFIQEYMLVRNWPPLRRAYGMCFVEECKRRELTRILVEMAIDFNMKANEQFREDIHLKVIVAECVLLYLNTVDLVTCEDLLLFNVQQAVLLCDVFMKTIADTQNFSRFKRVFINLTKFIVKHGRTFDLNVATHILERVCILPSELPLSEALLEIVVHTDQAIFEVSMMSIFEKQLATLNKDLYERFLVVKKESSVNRPVLSNLFESCLRLNPEVEPLINTAMVHNEQEKRYTSPDTTNLDNMNKATDEANSRTDFNRLKPFNIQLSISNSPVSKDSSEGARQVIPRPNFQSWKGPTIFDKIRGLPPSVQGSYISKAPVIKRRIHQQTNEYNGPSPTKVPRWSGPDIF